MIDIYIRATNKVDNVRIYHSESSTERGVNYARKLAKSISRFDKFLIDVWLVRTVGGNIRKDVDRHSETCVGRFKEGKEIFLVGDSL